MRSLHSLVPNQFLGAGVCDGSETQLEAPGGASLRGSSSQVLKESRHSAGTPASLPDALSRPHLKALVRVQFFPRAVASSSR